MTTQTIAWKKGCGQWTATVGAEIQCTILPPRADHPLPYYWWEIAGPKHYSGSGGSSSLKGAQRMVAERLDECEKKALRDPANITNLSVKEVGI